MHDWYSQSPPKRLSNDCQSELEDEVQGDMAGGTGNGVGEGGGMWLGENRAFEKRKGS